jgi:diadenosine tetraphosphate (Ap4A) HIT family hydrolase
MREKDCIFCKIVGGEMESEVVHDEEESRPSRSTTVPSRCRRTSCAHARNLCDERT